MLVIFAETPLVKATLPLVDSINSPTLPAAALSFVVVRITPVVELKAMLGTVLMACPVISIVPVASGNVIVLDTAVFEIAQEVVCCADVPVDQTIGIVVF